MDKEALNAFKDVIAFIEECRKNKTGSFIIRQGQFGFHYDSPIQPVMDKYGKAFSGILGEITNITVQVLNNNESAFLKDVQERTPKYYELQKRKIELIKEHIINERLIKDYHFLNNCTTAVLKGISFQTIIKPTKKGFPDLLSIITRVDIHNNQPEVKMTSFVFEMSPEQMDDIIKGFNGAKVYVSKLEETRNAEGKIEHFKAEI